MEGRKEGKDEEIKGGYLAIWPIRRREEWRSGVLVTEIEDSVVLKNCVSENKQKKKKIERARENCERYTVRKRAVCESKCCNLYLI